jgi:hypothetical protein
MEIRRGQEQEKEQDNIGQRLMEVMADLATEQSQEALHLIAGSFLTVLTPASDIRAERPVWEPRANIPRS